MSKRQDLSAKQKCDLLKSYDGIPKISLRDAAARLNVSNCTLNRILKNRSNIERAIMDNESDSRKRKRSGKEEVVDKALKEWFLQVRKKDARINGPLLRQKAEDLAKKMEKDDFVATEGWFQRWKKRETSASLKHMESKGKPILVRNNRGLILIGPICYPSTPPLIFSMPTRLGFILELYLNTHTHSKFTKLKGQKRAKSDSQLCVVSA
jgi:hypothetical protein